MKLNNSFAFIRRLISAAALALAIAPFASATETPVGLRGKVYIDVNCNGKIDYKDFPVSGVKVGLLDLQDCKFRFAVTGQYEDENGKPMWGFPTPPINPWSPVSGGKYFLFLCPPKGWSLSGTIPGPFSYDFCGVIAVCLPNDANGTYKSYDFLICLKCPDFLTYTQGGWGSPPNGCNPGQFLKDNFTDVYGTKGVTIGANDENGATKSITLTSAYAIEKFLPQGGNPSMLTASYVNPTSKLTVLAGQLLSVQLAVDFSNAGITTGLLGNLKVKSGPFAGKTVYDMLAIGNAVLGGNMSALPAGRTISQLNDTLEAINENFDGGRDRGYLGF